MKLFGIKHNKLLFEFKSCKTGHNEGVIFYSTAICNPNIFYLTAMNYDLWMKQKNFYAYHLQKKYILSCIREVLHSLLQQMLNMKTVSKHMGKI